METLKSLRAKAKELRSKVSSAPLSKSTPDQLRSEILMLERAVKADEKVQMRKALKDATVVPVQKKKTSETPMKVKVVAKTSPMEEREKQLLKREKMIAMKEKLFQTQQPKPKVDTESDSDGY